MLKYLAALQQHKCKNVQTLKQMQISTQQWSSLGFLLYLNQMCYKRGTKVSHLISKRTQGITEEEVLSL